jgi:hypothetical protein
LALLAGCFVVDAFVVDADRGVARRSFLQS